MLGGAWQRNSLADFAHANSLCTWGAIGKYQTTYTGPPLVLVPSFDGPSLYRGVSYLGHLSKSLYFSPCMQSLEHAWIFSTSRPMGQIICLAKYVFSGNSFFLGEFSLLYLTTDRSLYRSICLSIWTLTAWCRLPVCSLDNSYTMVFCHLVSFSLAFSAVFHYDIRSL